MVRAQTEKEGGKKCMVAKSVCLKGERSVGGMVVFGWWGPPVELKAGGKGWKLPSILLQGRRGKAISRSDSLRWPP